VISLAILADDDPAWRPSQFGYGRWGGHAGIRFLVRKLLDYAAHEAALEADANPFATLVLAHLKTLETRRAPADRHAWKLRLVRGLYERGMSAEDVRQLFRFIDWMMDLPPALEDQFEDELHRYQEEKQMPYITSIERSAMRKGLLEGLETVLDVRFGEEGLKLLPELREVRDYEVLQAVLRAAKRAASPDELRRIWTRRRPKKGRRT
jgi:hypothetical protein